MDTIVRSLRMKNKQNNLRFSLMDVEETKIRCRFMLAKICQLNRDRRFFVLRTTTKGSENRVFLRTSRFFLNRFVSLNITDDILLDDTVNSVRTS